MERNEDIPFSYECKAWGCPEQSGDHARCKDHSMATREAIA